MIKGTTVIFNEEYIDEITRHRDIAKQKYEVEDLPEEKINCKKALDKWEQKLDWALNFTDTVDSLENIMVPNITVVRTLKGYELPAKHLQLI